jgi:hypothetical protein
VGDRATPLSVISPLRWTWMRASVDAAAFEACETARF